MRLVNSLSASGCAHGARILPSARLLVALAAAAASGAPALAQPPPQPAVPAAASAGALLVVERFEVTGDNPLAAERTVEALRPYLG